jgi:hypothetical protein
MFDCILGIDPGVSNGGIVAKTKNTVELSKNPRKLSDMITLLNGIKEYSRSPMAVIEHISLYAGDLSVPGKIYGLQKLFNHYTLLTQAVSYLEIPYLDVFPATWQSGLNLKVKYSESSKERKNRYKRVAQSYFPGVKVTLWNSDALLLAMFGMKALTLHNEWVFKNLKY